MSREGLTISACPTCGSSAIRRVRGNWTGTFQGKTYTVKGLEYHSCSNCQEKVYTPEAMHKIQQVSPAFSRLRAAQRSVKPAAKSRVLVDS